MLAVAEVLVHFRIGRYGHPIGRRDEVVPRIVIERRAVSDDERLPLNAVNAGEPLARKWKIRCAPLQTHLTNSLTDGNLGNFVCVDPEPPVHPGFTPGVIRFP